MPKNLLNSISDSRTPDPSLDELEIPIKRIPINADLALIKILTIENRDKEIEYIYEELKARYMREDIYSNEFRADHRKEVHSIVKEEFTPTTVKEKLRDSIKYLIVLEVNEKYPNSKLSKEILLECIPKLIKKLFIYIHEDVPDNDDDDRFS